MFNKLLKNAAIILLAINFMACSTLVPAATPNVADVKKEEQAVYSFFVGSGGGPVLILENTSTDVSTDDPQEISEYIREGLPSLSNETAKNFLERNAKPGQLSPDMDLGVEYILLTSEELFEISSQPNWGEILTEKYPSSYGYTVFSRIGFNNTLDQAVLYVASVGGPLMGSGSYYLMEKKNGEWLLIEQINVWIS